MTVPVDICNLALGMIGARTTVQSINPSDGSKEANACATFYTPTLRMLLRAAHWSCAREQIFATQLKSLYVNGQLSTNPPPQPWLYEYAYPADCLKERFILRTSPQNAPSPPLTSGSGQFPAAQIMTGFARFTPALDTDSQGNRIKVFLTDQCQAQLVYTADISQNPDLWDAQFLMGAASSLAAYLVNPLSRNTELLHDMIVAAQGAIDSARATDGNEALPSTDHLPDWIGIRASWGGGFGALGGNGLGVGICGYDQMVFPGGISY